jgi:nucleoside-diphosphate-sugar epimerase
VAAAHRDDVGLAFANAAGNEKVYGHAYHAAGESVVTWNQYHQAVAAAIGAPAPRLVHIPTDLLARAAPQGAEWCRENFQYDNIFDNSAASRDLGYRSTIGLEEDVRRVAEWLDARGRMTYSDEPPWYQPLIDAWERHGTALAAEIEGFKG